MVVLMEVGGVSDGIWWLWVETVVVYGSGDVG